MSIYVIAGATGHVGSVAARSLLEKGHAVRAIGLLLGGVDQPTLVQLVKQQQRNTVGQRDDRIVGAARVQCGQHPQHGLRRLEAAVVERDRPSQRSIGCFSAGMRRRGRDLREEDLPIVLGQVARPGLESTPAQQCVERQRLEGVV